MKGIFLLKLIATKSRKGPASICVRLVPVLCLLGCGETCKDTLVSTVPPVYKPVLFDEVFRAADFIGIVEITSHSKKNIQTYFESKPPVLSCKVVAVLKGKQPIGSQMPILWQTKQHSGDRVEDANKDRIIVLPGEGEYLVFLNKGQANAFERFSEDWFFRKIPPAPNVVVQQHSLIQKKWRALTEVAPFISEVGEKVRYRFYRTRLDEETFEGEGHNFTADVITVIDFTRKRILSPMNPGTRIQARESVAKGSTVIHEIDLTKHFDLSKPGQYWILNADGPLRFEVSDKIQIRTPEK